jgi:hypothetical protein
LFAFFISSTFNKISVSPLVGMSCGNTAGPQVSKTLTLGRGSRVAQGGLRGAQAYEASGLVPGTWEKHGPTVLNRLAKKDPRAFVYAPLALVPKALQVDETRRIYQIRETPLTPEEWEAKHCGSLNIYTSL